MDKYKAIDLIGKTLYSYIIDYPTNMKEKIKAYVWNETIKYIGENEIYLDGYDIIDTYRIQKYDDYGKNWFLSKEECINYLNEICDEIIDETECE